MVSDFCIIGLKNFIHWWYIEYWNPDTDYSSSASPLYSLYSYISYLYNTNYNKRFKRQLRHCKRRMRQKAFRRIICNNPRFFATILGKNPTMPSEMKQVEQMRSVHIRYFPRATQILQTLERTRPRPPIRSPLLLDSRILQTFLAAASLNNRHCHHELSETIFLLLTFLL